MPEDRPWLPADDRNDPSAPFRQPVEGHPLAPPEATGGDPAGDPGAGSAKIDPPEAVGTGGMGIAGGGGEGAAGAAPGGRPTGGEGRAGEGRGGIGPEALPRAGEPIGGAASLFNIGGAPVSPGSAFMPGTSVLSPRGFTAGEPIGGPASIFNIGGAPIAILGGVFGNGLPIGGPVTQIFRGGSAPQPNTLFLATISPSGPIGNFLIGLSGAPIGVDTFGGGGLPIGPPAEVARAVDAIQSRTAAVTAVAVAFGGASIGRPVPPIGTL